MFLFPQLDIIFVELSNHRQEFFHFVKFYLLRSALWLLFFLFLQNFRIRFLFFLLLLIFLFRFLVFAL